MATSRCCRCASCSSAAAPGSRSRNSSGGAAEMSPTEAMLEVRGTRIHVLRGGSGQPLIFLHGASGHTGWLPFMERLSARFDVIVPEHPGFGASDDPAWLDRPGDLAYFYLDLIAALKLDRVHLI